MGMVENIFLCKKHFVTTHFKSHTCIRRIRRKIDTTAMLPIDCIHIKNPTHTQGECGGNEGIYAELKTLPLFI